VLAHGQDTPMAGQQSEPPKGGETIWLRTPERVTAKVRSVTVARFATPRAKPSPTPKRDAGTGRFMDGKEGGKPFKGVRKEV